MKQSIFIILAITFSFQASAKTPAQLKKTKEQIVCEKLNTVAVDNCTEALCDDAIKEGNECIQDGDFNEGLQVCVSDELSSLIKDYNTKHASAKISCDE